MLAGRMTSAALPPTTPTGELRPPALTTSATPGEPEYLPSKHTAPIVHVLQTRQFHTLAISTLHLIYPGPMSCHHGPSLLIARLITVLNHAPLQNKPRAYPLLCWSGSALIHSHSAQPRTPALAPICARRACQPWATAIQPNDSRGSANTSTLHSAEITPSRCARGIASTVASTVVDQDLPGYRNGTPAYQHTHTQHRER